MSIKTKLSAIIFGSVLLILGLNLMLNLYAARNNLLTESKNNMKTTAMQIAVSVEQSNYSSNYVQQQMAYNLRLAAILAAEELDPDISNVKNSQLKLLADKLGVSNISLLVQTEDDIIVAKSSDPAELGLSTKGMGFWYVAFLELFAGQKVSVQQGQTLDNFWSGPFEYSTSNPEYIEKWGYYRDPSRNYIIDPYIRSTAVSDYVRIMEPEEIVRRSKEVNPGLLEITGMNPKTFGSETMQPDGTDSVNHKLRNRPIRFGTYIFGNPGEDKTAMMTALRKEAPVTIDTSALGKRVLKSFIPIAQPGNDDYVISVVMDYSVISSVINEELVSDITTSVLLLVVFFICSYVLSGIVTRPIKDILRKVNDVAKGNFESPLNVTSGDELGQLASRINVMADHLYQHTNQLGKTLEENRAVKEHLESVINGTSDAIHTVDMEGRITSTNKAFEKLYGWNVADAAIKPPYLVPATVQRQEDIRLKELKEGAVLPPVETLRLKRDGSLVEVSVSTSMIRDEEGRPQAFVHVSRDMTERNRIEELLRRSEKLTTVGQLAAGVAHEIRNPLTTLRGFLQLQKEKGVLIPLHIDLMLSELDRINLIVSEFLILAKPQAVHFQEKDVRHILNDVISLLDSQAHLFGIEFEAQLSVQPARVHCEENQLKQVFINIVKNAIEAMPSGGTITVLQRIEGNSVIIVISDEGEGIPEEMLPKLGEPFFTNKETGTGLGLMVSQRIIQAHKGSMEISSEYGCGAEITIILPVA
ncbi:MULTISPECIES: ATP-binding protein [unclassified Paenibacillus]|uniref:ATP-binding protein n=1 Tax=unclassified Paenibacillus TaxID=185978 RepID=UPI002406E11D|nr:MULTISPECIES: ATP-binding protein [unclassified Paenibacillus]MDF9844877.1 two-component system, sporulation sensor kinase E [Paenibacillus sp. PastF-2]MDF9851476.1 two-component system, sporulation sensor kinase E [Paenibacillus sp. PastM-2]MDF9858060.1 two-component system, sporulation sensor kinase E [Paenibacillus sp. PastF-1]MDH6483353.1 two-component system, sporulation sensor kinase E [Paenibacillus sp. PastH-2]MDH6510762.1 two-component system, sporulation sensor kinase E [Paenibaci